MTLFEFLISWFAVTLGMFVAAQLLPRMEMRGGIGSYLGVSAIFGLTFALTGWLLHFALGVVTLGLLFVFGTIAQVLVAAIVLKITDAFSERLRIEGFGTALLAALIIGFVDGGVRFLLLSV